MEARNKLESEAPLEETKVILGWIINFQHLLIILPDKVQSVDDSNQKNDKQWHGNCKNFGNKHRSASPPRNGNPLCSPFSKSPTRSPSNHNSMTIGKNQWRILERSSANAEFLENGECGCQLE
jgi:hypothetical protein